MGFGRAVEVLRKRAYFNTQLYVNFRGGFVRRQIQTTSIEVEYDTFPVKAL